jgi:hypothetical protein
VHAGSYVTAAGVGKSHSTNCIIEGCMLPASNDVIKLRQPMITFVAHFDGDSDGICESVGLAVGRNGGPHVQNVVVLTSPTNHIYRKRAYDVCMHCAMVVAALMCGRACSVPCDRCCLTSSS